MTGQIHFSPASPQGIAEVVISHPGKLNALDTAMWKSLRAGFDDLRSRPRPPRVVVIRGEGGTFAAGGDIAEFPSFRFDPSTLAQFHEDIVAPALEALLACDQAVIAHIEGACMGGGLEIAACCDLRLCGASARFGIPIARLGFPMAPREIEIVARMTGETTLRELLLEARVLSADEAFSRRLVTRVLPDAELGEHVSHTAVQLAQLSPLAMRLNKAALRQFAGSAASSSSAQRQPHYAYAPRPDHREGLAAFNEKRPARFLDADQGNTHDNDGKER
jgi:enoyl-CoA hydratase